MTWLVRASRQEIGIWPIFAISHLARQRLTSWPVRRHLAAALQWASPGSLVITVICASVSSVSGPRSSAEGFR